MDDGTVIKGKLQTERDLLLKKIISMKNSKEKEECTLTLEDTR